MTISLTFGALLLMVVASRCEASPLYDPSEDLFANYGFNRPIPVHHAVDEDTKLHTLAKVLAYLTLRGAEPEEEPHSSEKRSGLVWRPNGGPLPVQTRFVSFGSRLEPGQAKGEGPSGIKAMRYGRRR